MLAAALCHLICQLGNLPKKKLFCNRLSTGGLSDSELLKHGFSQNCQFGFMNDCFHCIWTHCTNSEGIYVESACLVFKC